MKYLILLFSLLSTSALSDSIYLGMVSTHFYWNGTCGDVKCGEDSTPNSNNNLIMFEHKGYEIGTFKNSYSDQAYLIAKQIELFKFNDIKFVAHVGIDYGYHKWMFSSKIKEETLTRPVVIFEASYTKYKIEPVVFWFGNGLALSAKYKF